MASVRLSSLTVPDLKGVVWHYSLKRRGGSNLCVDPTNMTGTALKALLAKLNAPKSIKRDDVALWRGEFESTSAPDRLTIVRPAGYDDDAGEDDDADDVGASQPGGASSASFPTSAASSSSPPSSSSATGSSTPVTDAITSASPVAATQSTTGVKRKAERQLALMCTKCGMVVDAEHAGKRCNECGRLWRGEESATDVPIVGSSPATSASSPPSSSSSSNPIDSAKARLNVHSQVVSRAPDRSSLAPVAQSVLRAAREGKLWASTQTLLPALASVAGIPGTLEGTLFSISDGTIKTTSDKPQGKRRDVTDFSHLAEALVHGLIATFYPDDSTMCKEAWGLLSIAIDINREHGFACARHYVDAVLQRRYHAQWTPESAPNLQRDPGFSMADFHPVYLQTALHSKPAFSSNRPAQPSNGAPRPPSVCWNWNSGFLCKKTPCPFLHVCRTCSGSHQQTACTRGREQEAQPGMATPSGTSQQRPPKPQQQQQQRA
jgi:hypothetical protein